MFVPFLFYQKYRAICKKAMQRRKKGNDKKFLRNINKKTAMTENCINIRLYVPKHIAFKHAFVVSFPSAALRFIYDHNEHSFKRTNKPRTILKRTRNEHMWDKKETRAKGRLRKV